MQLEDLNRGTFGFVQLAYDRVSRQQVAIKFIERGDKVLGMCSAMSQIYRMVHPACPHTRSQQL
jgi:serine/threonine protein kinase